MKKQTNYDEWVSWALLVLVILSLLLLFVVYHDLKSQIDKLPHWVYHNESIKTDYVVCSVSSDKYIAIETVYFVEDNISSISINNQVANNCIPYIEEKEVCEII
jgi:hypothetical protein